MISSIKFKRGEFVRNKLQCKDMAVVLKPLTERLHPLLQFSQSITRRARAIFPPIRFWLKRAINHFDFVAQ
jgi:hypothetical protein